jgi:nitrogen-specific signal transduction histidine kinase
MDMFEGVTSDISFYLDMDNSVPLLSINREQIHQVFVNLIKNSIDAIPRKTKGLIKIKTLMSRNFNGHFVSIEIIDNGPGVPGDLTGRIYEPYFSTRKNRQGLGLSVVKRILEEHEARISYKRIDGKSVFTIEFPV